MAIEKNGAGGDTAGALIFFAAWKRELQSSRWSTVRLDLAA